MWISAQAAQCSQDTLRRLESGDPGVSLGVLARVMEAIGCVRELALLMDAAINVVRAFISQAHMDLKGREVFPFVEEVRRIALDKRLSHVCYEYNFDVLSAVPYEIFKDENFQSRRWPQIQALVAEQRRKQTR